MVDTPMTIRGLDTGQISSLNKMETSKSQGTKLELLKSIKNQQNIDNVNSPNDNVDEKTIVEPSNRQQENQFDSNCNSKKVRFEDNDNIKGVEILEETNESK